MMMMSVVVFMARSLLQPRFAVHSYGYSPRHLTPRFTGQVAGAPDRAM
jgi:hypothetical protein